MSQISYGVEQVNFGRKRLIKYDLISEFVKDEPKGRGSIDPLSRVCDLRRLL